MIIVKRPGTHEEFIEFFRQFDNIDDAARAYADLNVDLLINGTNDRIRSIASFATVAHCWAPSRLPRNKTEKQQSDYAKKLIRQTAGQVSGTVETGRSTYGSMINAATAAIELTLNTPELIKLVDPAILKMTLSEITKETELPKQ